MEFLVANLVFRYTGAHLLRHLQTCSIVVASLLLERGGRLSWLRISSVLLLGGLFRITCRITYKVYFCTRSSLLERVVPQLPQTTEQYSRCGRTKDR